MNFCKKCQRHNSMVEVSRNHVDMDKFKVYYECKNCYYMDAEVIDRMASSNSLDQYAYTPDLWWEDLPPKKEHVDKSKTDPWQPLGGEKHDILDPYDNNIDYDPDSGLWLDVPTSIRLRSNQEMISDNSFADHLTWEDDGGI